MFLLDASKNVLTDISSCHKTAAGSFAQGQMLHGMQIWQIQGGHVQDTLTLLKLAASAHVTTTGHVAPVSQQLNSISVRQHVPATLSQACI